ncbi:MAG: hypothetical protein MHM6MM_004317 [Cercozoa sp. M6MM]
MLLQSELEANATSAPTTPTSANSNDAAADKFDMRGLSKRQKRVAWNRLRGDGTLPRGHDWVDVVAHLSRVPADKQVSKNRGQKPPSYALKKTKRK